MFVAVVDQRSFTRAAEHLHLTQPAVSAQIRRLRAFAGTPILTRDGGRIVPTEAGRSLYQYARRVLGSIDALRRDLREIHAGDRDHIIVGGNRAYGEYLLPLLLSRFQSGHPSVRISLAMAESSATVERVSAGEVDIAVVRSERIPQALRVELAAVHLCNDPVVFMESPRHPFSRDQTLTLAEAAQVPFVRILREPIDGSTTGTRLGRLLSAAGLGPPRIAVEVCTWEGVKAAVRAGVGVASLPESVVRDELTNGGLRTLLIEGYTEILDVALITSPYRRRERRSLVFQALMRFLARTLPETLRTGSAAVAPDAQTDGLVLPSLPGRP